MQLKITIVLAIGLIIYQAYQLAIMTEMNIELLDAAEAQQYAPCQNINRTLIAATE